jgi:hypothetical protein
VKYIKIIDGDKNLKAVKLTETNLWMEPSTKLDDVLFWVERFKSQRVPYVIAQFDMEMRNKENKKMYRRVFGILIDMKRWENSNDPQ